VLFGSLLLHLVLLLVVVLVKVFQVLFGLFQNLGVFGLRGAVSLFQQGSLFLAPLSVARIRSPRIENGKKHVTKQLLCSS
jgi:hypothetical protein